MSIEKKIKRTAIILFISGLSLLGIVFAMGIIPQKQAEESKIVEAENLAYNFNLKELVGEKYYKLSDFRGKPVFLYFWASWCPPCRASVPAIEGLYEKFKDKVYVIGINLDRDVNAALSFLNENDIQFLQLAGTKSEAPNRYKVRGIPASFIIDKYGSIVKRYSGYTADHYNEWVEILTQLSK